MKQRIYNRLTRDWAGPLAIVLPGLAVWYAVDGAPWLALAYALGGAIAFARWRFNRSGASRD